MDVCLAFCIVFFFFLLFSLHRGRFESDVCHLREGRGGGYPWFDARQLTRILRTEHTRVELKGESK